MDKKSQLKTTETTIVLIIFLFLLAFGMIYFGRIYIAYLKGQGEETKEMRAKNLLLEMEFLSEIQCTKEKSRESDCLDIIKLQEFSKVYEDNKVFYSSLFDKMNVDVYQVFPKIEGHTGWSIISTDTAGARGGERFKIPITLFDSVNDTKNFGYLDIEVIE